MRRIRRLIYRLGYRPRPGSIFFSPSLSLIYLMKENNVIDRAIRAMKENE